MLPSQNAHMTDYVNFGAKDDRGEALRQLVRLLARQAAADYVRESGLGLLNAHQARKAR
jgi:hypothetical protein